ncbi:MAG: hypothetical protein RIC55_19865 [Pirellulaceae bacterium]
MLKAFAPFATICMLLTLDCASVPAEAHPASAGVHILLSLPGQSSSDAARSESDRLLAAARQAIGRGDLGRAEDLVDQATALGVKYDPVTARFEGPEKVRRDIAMMRANQTGRPAATPTDRGGRFPELLPPPTSAQQQADRIGSLPAQSTGLSNSPFADRPPIDPRTIQHEDGPVSGGAFSPSGATSGASAAPGSQNDVSRMLHEARRALAAGDMRSAAGIVAEAKQMGGQFAPHEDSPMRVEQVLERQRQIAQTPGDPQQKAKQVAQLMMEQAEALLRYNDAATARRLAEQAAQLPVNYSPYDTTPDQLLGRIDAIQSGGAAPVAMGREGGASTGADAGNANLAKARAMLAQAKLSMQRGQLEPALELVRQAESMDLSLEAFDNDEIRPWKLRAEIEQAMERRGGVDFAGYNANQNPTNRYPGAQSGYSPEMDRTRNMAASAMQPTPARLPETSNQGTPTNGAETMLRQGLTALKDGNRDQARELLLKVWDRREELDPGSLQMLQDHLTQLNSAPQAEPLPQGAQPSPLAEVEQKRLVLQEKVRREIISEQASADRMLQEDPLGALQKLQNLRDRVARSELDGDVRKAMLTLVDRAVGRTNQYIEEHRADIETDERNAAILQDLELDRKRRLETQNTLAGLVDKFNELIDQQRYAEAELIAKQAREIAPDEPVVANIVEKAKLARRVAEQMRIREEKEQGFAGQLNSVDDASRPFDDREPYGMPDVRWWEQMTADRARLNERTQRRITETEQVIYDSLKKKVGVSFKDRPLADVLSLLGNMAGVNIHADPTGLAAEGVTSATPISIDLAQEVSLQSALNLILEPLHLSYVVENEVLRITSEQIRESHTYHKVYNVADLVIPIPNFVPSHSMGLPGALRDAYNSQAYGGQATPAGGIPLTLASGDSGGGNSSVLAQMGGTPLGNGGRVPQQLGAGPGGLGGGARADFDSLIELITTTISPDSWDEVGGPGSISGFETNLSLVVSQTQEVHDQLADLLEQLRRLQDLQVTIEVRFITLNDDFFERIGIDFDFEIDSQSYLEGDGMGGFVTPPGNPPSPSTIVGLDPMGTPTGDLDLVFSQDSFGSALPSFGGFDATTAANFGFAILSDIEVFFLLQAAQGDTRANILQAPKVTLFNGQQAFVSDTSQTPFVTSVVPVVGDFAAAHQPVIVVLSEGTSLSVQAVVSQDRRFVRLTLVPFFSRIDSVQEFQFDGSTTTDTGTIVQDPTGTMAIGRDNYKTTVSGTTVQLPTFSFTTVTTTVSVPDGGTVLLGGIKRLSEGRTERSVPLLGKLPYINRLFRNVGIGRTTQSLMMMVTPRIIIQEEEEERHVGRPLS